MRKLKIIIATGVYPPAIGGPAQYAKNLKEEFEQLGHQVVVLTYGIENRLPTGLRHLLFFFRLVVKLPGADLVLALDTFSVALPAAVAARLTGKKLIIRVGGDFLWEQYVERTGELVLLRNFYQTSRQTWSVKEKLIFRLTNWLLAQARVLVFSTNWQKNIWQGPYDLEAQDCRVIENYYGPKEPAVAPLKKIFVAAGRNLKLRNKDRLRRAFLAAQKIRPEISLDEDRLPYQQSQERLRRSYAVLVTTISDVSPNLVLEALALDRPVIMTKETGILDRVGDVVLAVDPENEADLTNKILWLTEDSNYQASRQKIKNFSFTHSYQEIAKEFLSLAN